MNLEFKQLAESLFSQANFDCLGIGVVDFSKRVWDQFELTKSPEAALRPVLFDLASLTKPLTLSTAYLKNPKHFGPSELLLLNHKAGLPATGRLSKNNWKQEILNHEILPSEVTYSDYSALRLMLELEKKIQGDLYSFVKEVFDEDIVFWRQINDKAHCPTTGMRGEHPIKGEVHDDNAFVIGQFCSHAGLFGTVKGVCQTLLNIDGKWKLLQVMKEALKDNNERFARGWDTPSTEKETLAGPGHGPLTFGFLGFVGNSVWVDSQKQRGLVILSNATKNHWYDKSPINKIRKELGGLIWQTNQLGLE